MKKAVGLAVLFLLLLTLALVWTWPLALNLDDSIPYTARPRTGLERIPLYPGDHLQFYFRLWLFADSLGRGRPFDAPPYEFSIEDAPRRVSAQFFPLSLIYAAFAPLGAAAAYNILLLLTYPLTGLFTWLLLRSYGADRWGAAAGALAAAFLPYRVVQLSTGHPSAFVYFMVPLFLWLVERYLRTGLGAWAWLAALAFFSQSVMELHAAFYTFLLAAAYLPARWLAPGGRWLEAVKRGEPQGLSPWLAAVPAAALLVTRLAYLRVKSPGEPLWPVPVVSGLAWAAVFLLAWGVLRSLAGALLGLGARESTSLLLPPFLPLAVLPLYALRLLVPVPRLGTSLAAVAAVGALIVGWRSLRRLREARRVRISWRGAFAGRWRGLWPILLGMAASLAWVVFVRFNLLEGTAVEKGRSAGETLLFTPRLADVVRRANSQVEFYVYPGLVCLALVAAGLAVGGRRRRDGWPFAFFGVTAAVSFLLALGARGDALIPLYGTLRETVPFLGLGRVPTRVMIIFSPALAVLAGLATSRLTLALRGRRWSGAAGLLACAALLADYSPAAAYGLTRLSERNLAYEMRVATPGDRLAEVPIWPGDSAWSSVYEYWVTRYGHRMINGYNPVVPPGYAREVFQPLVGLNVGHLGEEEARILRRQGVNRLVLHEEVFPPQVSLFPFAQTLRGLESSRWLEFRTNDRWLWLFEVLDEPRAPKPWAVTSPAGVVLQGEAAVMNPAEVRVLPGGGGRAARASSGPAVRGPDRLFPAGTFSLLMRLGWEGRPGDPGGARLRVLDRSGEVLRESLLPVEAPGRGGMADHRFVFGLEKPRRVVFELSPAGEGALLVDYLSVTFADQEEPLGGAEFEDLPHAGRIVGEPGASGGRGVLLEAGSDPAMPFAVGPRRRLPPGRWKIVVRYRPGPGRGEAGKVTARELEGRALGAVSLDGEGGEFTVSSLEVDLRREIFLDLEVRYAGGRDLLLDRLEVRP